MEEPSGRILRWIPGKAFVIDDSFEHSVFHRGTSPRLVFILDVWHPEIQEAWEGHSAAASARAATAGNTSAAPFDVEQILGSIGAPVSVLRNNPVEYGELASSYGVRLPPTSPMQFLFKTEEGQGSLLVLGAFALLYVYYRFLLAPQLKRLWRVLQLRREKQERTKARQAQKGEFPQTMNRMPSATSSLEPLRRGASVDSSQSPSDACLGKSASEGKGGATSSSGISGTGTGLLRRRGNTRT